MDRRVFRVRFGLAASQGKGDDGFGALRFTPQMDSKEREKREERRGYHEGNSLEMASDCIWLSQKTGAVILLQGCDLSNLCEMYRRVRRNSYRDSVFWDRRAADQDFDFSPASTDCRWFDTGIDIL